MAHVTVHHTEQEWEAYARNYSWVTFFICRNTVRVNNVLEDFGEFICLDVGWPGNGVSVIPLDACTNIRSNSVINFLFLCLWSPVVSNEILVHYFHFVQCLV